MEKDQEGFNWVVAIYKFKWRYMEKDQVGFNWVVANYKFKWRYMEKDQVGFSNFFLLFHVIFAFSHCAVCTDPFNLKSWPWSYWRNYLFSCRLHFLQFYGSCCCSTIVHSKSNWVKIWFSNLFILANLCCDLKYFNLWSLLDQIIYKFDILKVYIIIRL